MTRAEAIKMLNRLLLYCDECPHGDCEKCVEAINMATEALQQRQEILPKHCIVPPNGVISSAEPYKIGYRNRTNGEDE